MPLVDGKKRNIFALAANESAEQGVIQVIDSERLTEIAATNEGQLSYQLAFAQDDINAARGLCEVAVNVELTLKQTCQRCLELADITAAGRSVVAVVRNSAKVDEYDTEYETVLHQGQDGIDIRQLVIDEAILAMPIIASHSQADCRGKVVKQLGSLQQEAQLAESVETDNPFAALAAIKKDLTKG